MTEEKIKKGKDQKSRWERGVCFFRVEISDSIGYNGAQHTYEEFDEL